ncbi:MAG: hypothetical protein V3T69_11705, partial [Acidiferrobacterales bacterium]
ARCHPYRQAEATGEQPDAFHVIMMFMGQENSAETICCLAQASHALQGGLERQPAVYHQGGVAALDQKSIAPAATAEARETHDSGLGGQSLPTVFT